MNRFNPLLVSSALLLLAAATTLAAGGTDAKKAVRDYTAGGNAVVQQYTSRARSLANRAITQIQSATTVPEAASAANKGRTAVSTAKGDALDDGDRSTLNSVADHFKVARDALGALNASRSSLDAPNKKHKATLQKVFESERNRITQAENARKNAVRKR